MPTAPNVWAQRPKVPMCARSWISSPLIPVGTSSRRAVEMLGLIAGRGALPKAVAEAAEGKVFVAALEGFDPEGLTPDLRFRIERLGSLSPRLRQAGVSRLCMAGAIDRPAIDPTKFDAATLPLIPRMMSALKSGDDAALRTVIEIFEAAGLEVVAAHEVAPSLLPGPGVMTTARPAKSVAGDIARGRAVLSAMGAADSGQACAVWKGQVLAIESVFGTDWMLASLVARPDGRGGCLFKGPKPGQDRRADLPVIGPGTVAGAAAAGLDGIAIVSGGVMVLEREATVRAADDAGLWIDVVSP